MSALAEAMLKAGLNKDKAEEVIDQDRRRERRNEREQNEKGEPQSLYDTEPVFSAEY